MHSIFIKRWNGTCSLSRKIFLIFITFSIGACGSGNSTSEEKLAATTTVVTEVPTQANSPTTSQFSILKFNKVSEKRVDRAIYEYAFSVDGKNLSTTANSGWKATITSIGPGTSVIQGIATFPPTAASDVKTSTNTVVLRVDRSLPFDINLIAWNFETIVVPPPPLPPPTDNSIAGIDGDSDGVRDDVQAYIVSKYSNSPLIRNALLQLAAGIQSSAVANTSVAREAATVARQDAAICLEDRSNSANANKLIKEIKDQQFNTSARIQAEINFNSAIAGRTETWIPKAVGATCK